MTKKMFKRFKKSFQRSLGETASERKAADEFMLSSSSRQAADEADYTKKISDSKQFIFSNKADDTIPATHNSHETGSCYKTDNCDNVLLKVIDHLLEENM